MTNIRETLRQLRLERGLTQDEVAEQVGLTRQAVSSYESGRTQPGLDILQRLADVYQVELTDLIYGRSRSLRLRKATKITAIVMAAVILAAQLVEALLRWLTNWYFPVTPGIQSKEQMALMEIRIRMDSVCRGVHRADPPLGADRPDVFPCQLSDRPRLLPDHAGLFSDPKSGDRPFPHPQKKQDPIIYRKAKRRPSCRGGVWLLKKKKKGVELCLLHWHHSTFHPI